MPNHNAKPERNQEIRDMWKDGKTLKTIGIKFGITKRRVSFLIKGVDRKTAPKTYSYSYVRPRHNKYYGIRHSDTVKFWEHVKIGNKDECWEWLGGKSHGYGTVIINTEHKQAHDFAYEWVNGPIPIGLEACHKCNNKGCCNPNHIYAGTRQQNMDDLHERYVRGELVRIGKYYPRRPKQDKNIATP